MNYYFEKDYLLTDYYDIYKEISYTKNKYNFFECDCHFDSQHSNYKLLKENHTQKSYDGRITFEEFKSEKELYLYNQIISTSEIIVYLFCQTGGCYSKIWINNELVWIDNSQNYSVIKLKLKQGINTVVYSIVFQTDDAFIICRFSKESEMFTDNIPLCINNSWYRFRSNNILCVHSGLNCIDKQYFDFLVLPGNFVDFNLNTDLKVEVSDYTGKIIYDTTTFNTRYRLNLNTFSHLRDIPECYLNIKISYNSPYGTVSREFLIYLNNLYQFHQYAISLALQARDIQCSEFDKQNLYCRLESISVNNYDIETARCLKEVTEITKLILEKKSLLDKNRPYPNMWVYLKSTLDNRVIKMCCHIPTPYDSNKKYPLFVFCHAIESHYSEDAHPLSNNYISADISVRGITAGSYTAEAALFEQIEWLCNNLSIDKNKIYLMGACNGASSALGMAQKYPSMFAGICVAGGNEHKENIRNLENLFVVELTSEIDSSYNKYQIRSDHLNNKDKYDVYIMNDMNMMLLQYLFHQEYIIQKMLSFSSDEYPYKIYFKTFRNRNNRCFWLKINGIRKDCIFAEIEAEIKNNTLHIITTGIDNLTLDFSKNEKLYFDKIVINNNVIYCNDCKDIFHLVFDGSKFSLIKTNVNQLLSLQELAS